MLTSVLFVISAVCCLLGSIRVISALVGNLGTVPLPLLHLIGIEASHTYIYTPSLAYQVYFWASYFSII